MKTTLGRWCLSAGLMASPAWLASEEAGETVVTRWQDDKRGAVSLTYDDGSLNQFRVAVPLMDRLGLPATFFVITGDVLGSRYGGRFVGRSTEAIVRETAEVPTGADNFFERASAIGHLGYEGALEYHTRAGALYEQGRVQEAYAVIDQGYARARAGALLRQAGTEGFEGARRSVTWDELAELAKRGHEIASHTVTHPRLAVLDDANLAYELERSRQEILERLGPEQTFSIECPYGTEDERAVRAALARYPASRNLMPEPFLVELHRSSDADPAAAAAAAEYVQWQRGPLTGTPMALMKSWIDTVARGENIWLVLVFHGVDGVGWEPRTGADLAECFEYVGSRRDRLWVATFRDVTKYVRERQHSQVHASWKGSTLEVDLRHDLDRALYDLPLTLRTEVPAEWAAVEVRQGPRVARVAVVRDGAGARVTYRALPNAGPVTLARAGE